MSLRNPASRHSNRLALCDYLPRAASSRTDAALIWRTVSRPPNRLASRVRHTDSRRSNRLASRKRSRAFSNRPYAVLNWRTDSRLSNRLASRAFTIRPYSALIWRTSSCRLQNSVLRPQRFALGSQFGPR